TGIHRALEAYYGRGEDPAEFWKAWSEKEFQRMSQEQGGMFREEEEIYLEQRELGISILSNYLQFAKQNDNFEALMTEQQFEVPIRHPVDGTPVGLLVGTFDGIVRTPDGLWLLEHKTSADRWSEDSVDPGYLDQVIGYMYAGQLVFGQPLDGVLFNILRKKVPRVPPLVYGGKQ